MIIDKCCGHGRLGLGEFRLQLLELALQEAAMPQRKSGTPLAKSAGLVSVFVWLTVDDQSISSLCGAYALPAESI
eukprot:COSAG01_NODE_25946_length_728_cov_1.001590_1_plen_74_part_10